jgi:SAM-dependent methyltransferase
METGAIPTGTVGDFSEQWTAYYDNSGFFGSEELLSDVLRPLHTLDDLRGKAVAEIGCGNGRFLPTMAKYASKVIGIEPGDGVDNARDWANKSAERDKIEVMRANVYDLPALPPLDHVLSIGVVHHLPDPERALQNMRRLLKPGGHCTIWVYGKEGNELYLATFGTVRKLTTRLPHKALHVVSSALVPPLRGYIAACRVLPLPMKDYMRQVLHPLDWRALRLNIYDQLNPTIAEYWTRDEVTSLMERAGFKDIRLHHRHGYSWTATGTA